MDPETKRHIDGARQVLVGVVPNPVSQIDQITYALIYKFMDDMDQASLAEGGEPSFFIKDLERYAWTRLMDTRLGNQERMNLYSEAFIKFAEAEQLPELFRSILKSAFLPYRSPEVLWLFLKEIDYFDYSHPEELGNAYEYLLSIMGSQGDAGQFRTPRHIIDFIVDVIQPTENDKILDPACGTGGFLVKAYQHILEQHQGEKRLTPPQKLKLMDQFEGYDIDPGMVRISQVNMFLHNFKNPKILQYDTLSMEEKWNDRFDVIMANPPFMSPKGGIKPHSKFSVQSTRSEVLFVDYIMNHLKPKGRAGIIVPEGIIFQSGNAYKQLRKNLVNDGLYAVVSLPSGVFQPYSGVKTSILFFNNEIAKLREEILFVKVDNDGYDLGATKRPINKNDLPEALEILSKWYNNEKAESQRALYVTKTKLSETGDYNLSGDRYRVTTDYSNAKWPMVELGEVCEILDKLRKPIEKSERKIGIYPYYGSTGIVDYISEFLFDERLVLIGEDGAKWKSGEKTSFIVEGKYWVNNHAHVLRPSKTKLNDSFLVYIINFLDLTQFISGITVPKLNQEKLKEIKIPLPPLKIQQQIVEELDSYQNIISGARQIIANWKPRIDINPSWSKVKLGEVAKVQGGFAFKSLEMTQKDGSQIIKIGNVKDLKFDSENNQSFINLDMYDQYKDYQLNKGDILISMTGTVGKRDYGNVCMVDKEGKYLLNQRLGRIIPNSLIFSRFLYYILNQEHTKDQFYTNTSGGVRQGNISNKQIGLIEIPLPPLDIQNQIVDRIESERLLVEGTKKLISLYTQKISNTLAKLWEEGK